MSAPLEAPDIISSSNAYARRFSGAAGRFFLDRQEQIVFRALHDKRAVKVLDVGGGHAQLSGPLAQLGHHVTVTGSAPDCAGRLALDPRNVCVGFVQAGLEALPFESRSFDTVISIRLMAHVENWQRFLAELCRVAEHTVVIDYPELASYNILSLAIFELKRRIEGDTRPYRNFWASTLKREFAQNGFAVTLVQRQFLLPMALHRAGKGIAPLRVTEQLSRRIGLTSIVGNPGIMRADRIR